MKYRLSLEEIFTYIASKDFDIAEKTFKDGIEEHDPRVWASLITHQFFNSTENTFLEKLRSNKADIPTDKDKAEIEAVLYEELYKFLNNYKNDMPSLIEAVSRSTNHDETRPSIVFRLCRGVACELGTMFADFSSGNRHSLSKKLNITDQAYPFKESFSHSYLKIFGEGDKKKVRECIKNTWFGRFILLEDYEKTKSIRPEDRSVLKEILWERSHMGKLVPSYKDTNLKFFGSEYHDAGFCIYAPFVITGINSSDSKLKALDEILIPHFLQYTNYATLVLGCIITDAVLNRGVVSIPNCLKNNYAATIFVLPALIGAASWIMLKGVESIALHIMDIKPVIESPISK